MSEPLYKAVFYVKNVDRNYTVTGITEEEMKGYETAISQGAGISINLPNAGERLYFAPGQVSHIFATRTRRAGRI